MAKCKGAVCFCLYSEKRGKIYKAMGVFLNCFNCFLIVSRWRKMIECLNDLFCYDSLEMVSCLFMFRRNCVYLQFEDTRDLGSCFVYV